MFWKEESQKKGTEYSASLKTAGPSPIPFYLFSVVYFICLFILFNGTLQVEVSLCVECYGTSCPTKIEAETVLSLGMR